MHIIYVKIPFFMEGVMDGDWGYILPVGFGQKL